MGPSVLSRSHSSRALYPRAPNSLSPIIEEREILQSRPSACGRCHSRNTRCPVAHTAAWPFRLPVNDGLLVSLVSKGRQ
ncbi:hypothetical protein VTI28DRAFT_501 [Corynascus sepedonium]